MVIPTERVNIKKKWSSSDQMNPRQSWNEYMSMRSLQNCLLCSLNRLWGSYENYRACCHYDQLDIWASCSNFIFGLNIKEDMQYCSIIPVSEIAIVSMVSMLFHGISVELYGIQVECHGIPWNAMDVMLFPWNFSGILWLPGGMPWNSMEFHGMPWTLCYFHGIAV